MSKENRSENESDLLSMLQHDPDKLAENIARLDSASIIIVALISEVGEIFGFYVNEKYRSEYSTDRKKYEMTAARLAVGFGAALATDKEGIVSETEAIAIIRRTTIHYYTKIQGPKKPTIVAVWFNREKTDVGPMSDKIRRFLGSLN